MDGEQEFVVGRSRVRVSRAVFEERLIGVEPERVRKYSVDIGGRRFPVKQAVGVGLGVIRAGFQTQEAISVLRRLGYNPTE
jgi:hypothetical protein